MGVALAAAACGVAPAASEKAGEQPDPGRIADLEERIERLEAEHPAPTPTLNSDELRLAEFHDVGTAMRALMTENRLSSIPNPVSGNRAPCVIGTHDMTTFPDVASKAGSTDKLYDPNGNPYIHGDRDGYLLFGHDITAGDGDSAVVNYINRTNTTSCYTIQANGAVRQYNEAGAEVAGG